MATRKSKASAAATEEPEALSEKQPDAEIVQMDLDDDAPATASNVLEEIENMFGSPEEIAQAELAEAAKPVGVPVEETAESSNTDEAEVPPPAPAKAKKPRTRKQQLEESVEPEEDAEPDADSDEEPEVQGYELLLNPNEFKLLSIQAKGDRQYRVQFSADDLSVSTDRTLQAEAAEDHPFEKVLKQIGQLIFPLAFSDQTINRLTLSSLSRSIKQNKNKEPKTYYVVAVENNGGAATYTSKSRNLAQSELPADFQNLFNELENYLREEISKKATGNEQLGLFDESEEDDE